MEQALVLLGTMNKNNKRVITVILGAQNDNERFSETKKLLNYSF